MTDTAEISQSQVGVHRERAEEVEEKDYRETGKIVFITVIYSYLDFLLRHLQIVSGQSYVLLLPQNAFIQ